MVDRAVFLKDLEEKGAQDILNSVEAVKLRLEKMQTHKASIDSSDANKYLGPASTPAKLRQISNHIKSRIDRYNKIYDQIK
jgi:hypothetical protein